jgi:hypothetical protein
MKQLLTVALGAALFSAAALPAGAQDTGLIPVRAKIGALYPTNGNTRDLTGNFHLGGEVDVAIPRFLGGRYIASVGYTQGSEGGNKLRMIPVTIGRYFQPPNPAKGLTGNVYTGLGVGAYFVKGTVGGVSDNKTTLGGYGVVGYQFPNPYFVEAKYHLVGKVNGLRPGGLAVMVGRHF